MASMNPSRGGWRRIALGVAVGYGIVGALWIVVTNLLIAIFVGDPRLRQPVQTLKGWSFVAITGVALYALVARYLRRIEIGERGLRGSERRLERIVATIPSAVLIIDNSGRMTMANAAAEKMLRLSSAEITSRTYDDPAWRAESLDGRSLPPRDFPFARVLATGESVYDARFTVVQPDGTRAILSSNASPLTDEAGETIAVVTVVTDITDEYTAEQKLVHVNRLYSMLSQTNEAITRIRDERELYEAACRITVEYGQFRMAWVGIVDAETHAVVPAAHAGEERGYLGTLRVTTDDVDEGRGPVGTAARLGRTVVSNDVAQDPFVLTWRERMLERGYRSLAAFPLSVDGRPFGVFAIYASEPGFFDSEEIRLLEDLAEDISFGVAHIRQDREREVAEAKLQRWKDIFDETRIGIAISEGPDVEKLAMVNAAYARMHGWEPEDVAGKSFTDFYVPEEREAVRERLRTLDATGHLAYEATRLRKDGSTFPAAIDVTVVYDDRGDVRWRIANVQDVTERRRSEGELARHREHLEELVEERTAQLREANERLAEATEAKSRFLANMSHELRTPLNSVIGFSEMMLQGMAGALNAEQEKQLRMVDRAGKQLLGVVNDVLQISKLEAGRLLLEPSDFDLAALVEDVLATIRPLADEKGLPLEASVRNTATVLRTDREKLSEILVNVLANAVKFTERGSVRLDAAARGEDAVFVVTDTGMGIAAEDIARIFGEFEQARRPAGTGRSVRGTGLGLAISKRLTEMLGGSLSVESRPGRGSSFTLRVPLVLAEETKEDRDDRQ